MTGMSPEEVVELKNTMAGLAEIFRTYYLELREQGFSRREAMQLVVDYQREIVSGSQTE